MTSLYRISAARPADLALLPEIELAAAMLLAGHAPESVLSETTSHDILKVAQRQGRLWVAIADDVPVGFAHVEVLDVDTVHLEEIDVHPVHGRLELGARLVTHVCRWAADAGYRSVTLTTFRDIPWNMPFYARLGFTVAVADDLPPVLRAIVEEETMASVTNFMARGRDVLLLATSFPP